jgi:cytochrome c oxidase cbb3-type subunit 3
MNEEPKQEPKRGAFARRKGEVVLREHEYDGIQEYDQKLPNWWLFTFYGAVVWFVVYWVLYYHTNVYQTDHQRVAAAITQIQQAKAAELEKTLATLDDQVLVHDWAAKPDVIAAGEATYTTICSACHAADLSATLTVAGGVKVPLPGLPLNDGEWKFGGKPMDLFRMVSQGSPPESTGYLGTRMQAGGGANLTPKQVAEVVAYLIHRLPDEFSDIPPK